jgi:CHAT domain-containing protein
MISFNSIAYYLRFMVRSSSLRFSAPKATPANGNFKTDPDAPFAHPFVWAPFILMGNWL